KLFIRLPRQLQQLLDRRVALVDDLLELVGAEELAGHAGFQILLQNREVGVDLQSEAGVGIDSVLVLGIGFQLSYDLVIQGKLLQVPEFQILIVFAILLKDLEDKPVKEASAQKQGQGLLLKIGVLGNKHIGNDPAATVDDLPAGGGVLQGIIDVDTVSMDELPVLISV